MKRFFLILTTLLFLLSGIFCGNSTYAEIIQNEKSELIGLDLLQKDLMPKHISFIADGNRRWATQNGLYTGQGHIIGAEKLIELIKFVLDKDLGIDYLSFFGFSTENWNRRKDEVEFLINVFCDFFDELPVRFKDYNIKIETIGDITQFPEKMQQKVQYLKDNSSNDPDLTVIMALNYGGREEIKRAFSKILDDIEIGKISKESISEKLISRYLDTSHFPDPDLIIRTSGEIRVSNYLLWQMAYSEFCFEDVFWPDFSNQNLIDILLDFQSRDRRFGGNKNK